MKKIIFILITALINYPCFATTCLELNYSLNDSSNSKEFIYIDNETQNVKFDNHSSVDVLQYDNNIIRFKTQKPDVNEKGYIIESYYEINRYTGGCNVKIYKKAIGVKQKFDNALFGLEQNFLYRSGTGYVNKVDTTIQKF